MQIKSHQGGRSIKERNQGQIIILMENIPSTSINSQELEVEKFYTHYWHVDRLHKRSFGLKISENMAIYEVGSKSIPQKKCVW
jgi:hypothetical protein